MHTARYEYKLESFADDVKKYYLMTHPKADSEPNAMGVSAPSVPSSKIQRREFTKDARMIVKDDDLGFTDVAINYRVVFYHVLRRFNSQRLE